MKRMQREIIAVALALATFAVTGCGSEEGGCVTCPPPASFVCAVWELSLYEKDCSTGQLTFIGSEVDTVCMQASPTYCDVVLTANESSFECTEVIPMSDCQVTITMSGNGYGDETSMELELQTCKDYVGSCQGAPAPECACGVFIGEKIGEISINVPPVSPIPAYVAAEGSAVPAQSVVESKARTLIRTLISQR